MKYIDNISPAEFERIERFLTNNMQENEARAFEQELAADEELRSKKEEVKLLLLGISESSLQEKLDSFHRGIVPSGSKKNTPIVRLGRKLAVAASILAIVALSLWWFLQSGNKNEKLYSKYYSPDPGLATVMSNSSSYDFEKAMVEYKNGEYDKALQAWQTLLKDKPGNDTLVYFIAAAYQAKKDDENAMKNLQQVAENNNSAFYKDACWYLGLAYLKKGNTKQAIEYIERSAHPQQEAILKAINKK